jgi:hypothetical protein
LLLLLRVLCRKTIGKYKDSTQRGNGAKVFVAAAMTIFESGGNRRRSCQVMVASRRNAAGN